MIAEAAILTPLTVATADLCLVWNLVHEDGSMNLYPLARMIAFQRQKIANGSFTVLVEAVHHSVRV